MASTKNALPDDKCKEKTSYLYHFDILHAPCSLRRHHGYLFHVGACFLCRQTPIGFAAWRNQNPSYRRLDLPDLLSYRPGLDCLMKDRKLENPRWSQCEQQLQRSAVPGSLAVDSALEWVEVGRCSDCPGLDAYLVVQREFIDEVIATTSLQQNKEGETTVPDWLCTFGRLNDCGRPGVKFWLVYVWDGIGCTEL